jgi:hypothetical protein
MADVRLDFYDLDAEELPDVCMRCGEPSTVRPVKSFRWMPPWARFVPPIVGVWFIKRRRAPIPLCDKHKNHWLIPRLIGYGGAGVLVLLVVALLMTVVADAGNKPSAVPPLISLLIIVLTGVLFVAWLITMIVLAVTRINAVEITDDTITLKNVHSDFTRAYREMTRGGITPEVEEIVREKWAQSSSRGRPERDEPRRPRRDDSPPDDKYRRG